MKKLGKYLVFLFISIVVLFCLMGCSKTYAIGDTGPGGGVVFYVENGGTKGLEAARASWYSGTAPLDPAIAWSTVTDAAVPAGTSTAMGTGLANSNAIVAQNGGASSAAKLCRDFQGGGRNDWYLPSKDELALLATQISIIGGFSNWYYWSSSEAVYGMDSNVWSQYFNGSNPTWGVKTSSSTQVRPIRSFEDVPL